MVKQMKNDPLFSWYSPSIGGHARLTAPKLRHWIPPRAWFVVRQGQNQGYTQCSHKETRDSQLVINLQDVVTYLYFSRSEHTWMAWVKDLVRHCASGTITASQVLEGSFADSGTVYSRISESLRTWRDIESAISLRSSDIWRQTMKEVGETGGRGNNKREVEMSTICIHETSDVITLLCLFLADRDKSKSDNHLITHLLLR